VTVTVSPVHDPICGSYQISVSDVAPVVLVLAIAFVHVGAQPVPVPVLVTPVTVVPLRLPSSAINVFPAVVAPTLNVNVRELVNEVGCVNAPISEG